MMRKVWRIIVLSLLLISQPVPAERIELHTGEVLIGKVVASDQTQIIVDHPVLGRLTIPQSFVRRMVADDRPVTQGAAEALVETKTAEAATATDAATNAPIVEAGNQPAIVAADASATAPGFWEQWKSTLDLGLSGDEGSNRKTNIRAALRSQREVEDNRTRLGASYHLGTDRSRRNRQEVITSLGNDWLMPDSPWFYFAQGQYQFDEFKDWRHRLSGEGGAGYEFINTDKMKLRGRSGPGASYELQGERRGLRPEWVAGVEWEWLPAERHKLTFTNMFVHDLLTMDRYRNKSVAAWTIRLDDEYRINLRLSVENEYDSSPLEDRTYNDLKYFGALQWEF